MNKLPNAIMNFSDETRRNSYAQIKEYFDCYKNGKTANASGVSFAEMDKKVLEFFTSEIERMSGRKMDPEMDLKQYCLFTDVKESAFAIVSVMTDLVLADTLYKDLGTIAEIKNGAWGDSLKVDMRPRDLFVVAKGGRDDAEKRFIKILEKGEKYENIINGCKQYIEYCKRNNQLTCGVAVFLNKERWKDDYSGNTCESANSNERPKPRSILETYAKIAAKLAEKDNIR